MININKKGCVCKQIFIFAFVYLGQIVVGYTTTWSVPVITKLQDLKQSPLPGVITLTDASWISSVFIIGITIGSQLSGPVSNWLGRKPSIIVGECINVTAHIVLVFSCSFSLIIAGRVLSGIGIGFIFVTNIVYLGEISPSYIRGILISTNGFFHVFGSVIAYSVGPYVSYEAVSYVLLGMAALHILGIMLIPESPLYHAIKGRIEEAKNTLHVLGRGHDSERELKMLVGEFAENKDKTHWTELITIKSNRKSLYISLSTFLLQQSSGVFIAIFFVTSIFEMAESSIEPALATIAVGVTQLFGTLLVIPLIEKAGRKTLLLISTAGCGVSMMILGAYFYLERINHPALHSIKWLPMVALMTSFFSYSVGSSVIPNIYTSELFRPNVRSIGSSIVVTVTTLLGFTWITTYGYLVEAFGNHWVFVFFGVINVLGFVFIFLVIPETKGMTLSEIEEMLAK